MLGLAVLLTTACGVKKYMPEGPVLTAEQRAADFGTPETSGTAYLGDAEVLFPVLPLQAWGVHYDLDLVLVSKHPDYDMHEYARINGPDGPIWLAKDADAETLTQTVVADIDNLDRWVPELPIARKQSPVKVTDRGSEGQLDLTIEYSSFKGEKVVVTYAGPEPTSAQKKRNGNTMGHSADIVMAVLDIPARDFAKRASITIDGAPVKIQKAAGLKPLQLALVQTQAGFAVSQFTQEPAPEEDVAFTQFHKMQGGGLSRLDWTFRRGTGKHKVMQSDGLRTISYIYSVGQGAVELAAIDVEQHGIDEPILHVDINPSLPDLRRKWAGKRTSRFVVDVGGSQSHATGTLEAWWDGDAVKVQMTPDAPDWVLDRPMLTTVKYGEGKALVSIVKHAVPIAE